MFGYPRYTELHRQARHGYSGNALTTSTTHAADCEGIMSVVLADIRRVFQRMLQKGAESQALFGWDLFLLCIAQWMKNCAGVFHRTWDPWLTSNCFSYHIASHISHVLEAKWQLKALMLSFFWQRARLRTKSAMIGLRMDRVLWPIFMRKTHKACAQEV